MDASTNTPAAAGAELALPYLLESGEFTAFAAAAARGAVRARVSPPLLPLVAAALWRSRSGLEPRGLAVVVADDDAARTLIEAAALHVPEAPAAYLPSRGAVYGSGIDPAPHLVGERSAALDAAAAGGLIAVSVDALLERVPGPSTRPRPVVVEAGSEPGLEQLVEALVAAGYTRVDTVEERGEVSVRGGLVDVFPTTGREPLRIEFFGDEIERLSAFSVFTQRSIRELERAVVRPAGEPTDLEAAWGVEEGAPAVPGGLVSLIPELTANAAMVVWNAEETAGEMRDRAEEVAETLRDAQARGRAYVKPAEVEALLDASGVLEELPLGQRHSFEAQPPALASFGIAEAENELRALIRAGYRVLVAFPHQGEAERMRLALNRVEAEVARPGLPGPDEPAWRSWSRRCATALSSPGCDWRCCRRRSCSAGGRPGGRSGWAARWPPSATSGPVTTSSTTTTGSAASSSSTPARWAASCATTCTSSSAATTGCTSRTSSWGR
jgi:transcription-repair coupling factor (superfamily II helicase)